MINTFSVSIKSPVIEDLKERIARTIWPWQPDENPWKSGTDKTYLKSLCDYWQTGFDWQDQEKILNTFQHFTTEIEGQGIHFIHHRGEGTTKVPIILMHGFPDSFVRLLPLIPLLTKADENGFCFDVVVPSLPGYGFSPHSERAGMDTKKIASLMNELMTRELGYEKYMAHGGDWGGGVAEQLGLYHAENIIALHLTDIPFQHGMTPVENPSHAEKKLQEKRQKWLQTEGAYATIQSTKPQTLAYGLTDSPVGLAGWIIEKFYSWSDNDGDLESAFPKDVLLTNLTIYWATQTINSAMRLYYEAISSFMNAMYNPLVKLNPLDKTGQIPKVPAAFAIFPKDISVPPREYAERFFQVARWTEMPAGGHFAALEKPGLLAADIRAFGGEIFR